MKKAHPQKSQMPPVSSSGAERLAIWRQAKSVLKSKAGKMLKEVEKSRREWEEREKALTKIWVRLGRRRKQHSV